MSRVPEEKLKQLEKWAPDLRDGPRIAKAAALAKDLVADIRDLQAKIFALTHVPTERHLRSEGALTEEASIAAGSDTSGFAARAMAGRIGYLQQCVLEHIREAGDEGATDAEMEHALRMTRQTVTPRRRELVLKGMVRDSGRSRLSEHSKQANTVWVAVQDL